MSLNMLWHIETFNLVLILIWLLEILLSQSCWDLEENGQYINSWLCRQDVTETLSFQAMRVSQMKILNIFYLVIYWTQRYTMTSFFYVASIAFHASVPALWKCIHTSRKNSFGWECSHSCTVCCTSSSDLKDLSPIASLSGPKTWKSLGGKVWRVWRMWKTLEGQILDSCNSWTGSVGLSIVMLEQNTCTQTSM